MKEILIVENTTYAAKTGGGTISGADQLDLLAAGAVAVFNEEGELVDPANPSATLTGDRFYMAVGLTGAAPRITSLINRATFEYSFQEYEAPANVTIRVTPLNLPTLAAGQTATLVLYNKSKRHEEWNKNSTVYTYVVKTGDTADEICDGLAAAINADTSKFVASASNINNNGTGVEIVGLDGIDFKVIPQDILENARLSSDFDYLAGQGTYAQVKEAELQADVRRGKQNSFLYTNELWSLPSNAVSGHIYDIVTCNWRNATEDALQTLQPTYKKELIIAVNHSYIATVSADMNLIFVAV